MVQQLLLSSMRRNTSSLNVYATRVEAVVDTLILERTGARTQDMANWSFPFDKTNGKKLDVTFNNKQAKKFAKHFKHKYRISYDEVQKECFDSAMH